MSASQAAQQPLWGAGPVRALGFDPGSRFCGWGAIDREGRNLVRVDSGVLRPKTDARLDYRLAYLRDAVLRLLDQHKPDVCAVESPFVPREAKQYKGALVLAQARGVVACAIGACELRLGEQMPFVEVHASSVKKCVAATGRAKKAEVQRAVSMVLGLGVQPLQEDEADALAVAICAAMTWQPRRTK